MFFGVHIVSSVQRAKSCASKDASTVLRGRACAGSGPDPLGVKGAIDRDFYKETKWNRKKAVVHQCSEAWPDEANNYVYEQCSKSGGTEILEEENNYDGKYDQNMWIAAVVGEAMLIMKRKGNCRCNVKRKGQDGKNGCVAKPYFDKIAEKDQNSIGTGACFECGEDGHLARDCAMRKSRTAAGGLAIVQCNLNSKGNVKGFPDLESSHDAFGQGRR